MPLDLYYPELGNYLRMRLPRYTRQTACKKQENHEVLIPLSDPYFKASMFSSEIQE